MTDASIFTDLLGAIDAKPENWSPQTPHPKQLEFMRLTCDEALFGGAAGPGKSSALLMDPLQYVHVPGYAALILRKSYGELSLEGGLMDRAKDWFRGNERVHWHALEKRFEFPSGATISFGFCKHKVDLDRYFSSEFQYIGIDELTQWDEDWYMLLTSRLRKLKGMDVPTKMRAASNPGNKGHAWVLKRFGCNPGMTPVDGCAFVPALAKDNPTLDIEDYMRRLSKLPATRRRQLEMGEWVEDTEAQVYKYETDRNSIASLPVPIDDPRWTFILGMDFGVRDATAFVVGGWLPNDPTVYIVEVSKHKDLDPTGAAELAKGFARSYRFTRMIGDVGGLGKAFAQEMIVRHQLPIEPAEKHNKLGYQRLINGALERGHLKILMPQSTELADEWATLPRKVGSDVEADGYENHAADACLYTWRACGAFMETPLSPALPPEERRRVADLEVEAREIAEAEAEVDDGRDRSLDGLFLSY